MTTEIILQKNIAELRKIYFGDKQGKFIFGPQTKRQSTYLLIALLIYPFFARYTLKTDDVWWFIWGTIFFSFFMYDFWKVAQPILRWKKSTEAFLNNAENIQDLRFEYNDTFYVHIEDQDVLKQEWSVVERAIINDQFIGLYSNTHILLPSASMRPDEFTDLSKMVMEKCKNVSSEMRQIIE